MRANAHDSPFCGRSQGGFRLCGHVAVDGDRLAAFRSPPPPLRPSLIDCIENKRRQVAAALSAAVTTTPKQGNAPTSHGREPPKEEPSLFPAALRERGSGGEALLSEKRPLPQNLRTAVFPGGSAREGAFLQKGPLPRILSLSHNFFAKGLALFGKMGYNKDVSFVNVRVLR